MRERERESEDRTRESVCVCVYEREREKLAESVMEEEDKAANVGGFKGVVERQVILKEV